MSNYMKWVLPFIFILLVVFAITYNIFIQNTATITTSEIELLAESISVGMVRGEIEEDGERDFTHFDKEELVTNLISEVSAVQKQHKYNVKLDYIFTDKEGNITEQDNLIRGIQFRVQFTDRNGKPRGTAERHLALNYLAD